MRWQTFMLTASGLIVGVPLGLVANRFVWNAFTDRLGVAPGTIVPTAIIAVGSFILLALGYLLATSVGRRVSTYARATPFIA